MDKCGIICEYNPFHNGHKYHIEKTKEITGCEIVCVMSGDFVQRAEPAIFDKRLRALAAIKNGSEAVIELPVVFSTAGAPQFAAAAVEILSSVKGLKYLSFGIETDNSALIEAIAQIQLNENEEFKAELESGLNNGESYAKAYAKATLTQLIKLGFNQYQAEKALKEPNNILGAEYLKAIKTKNLKIKPVYIKRCDCGYNNLTLTPPFVSANAIRTLIESGKNYDEFVPFHFGASPLKKESYEAIIRRALLDLAVDDKNPPGDEGILKMLRESAKTNYTTHSIIMGVKSKRHTYARIKRSMLCAALGINESLVNYTGAIYCRLLAVNNNFKASIKDLPKTLLIKAEDEKTIPKSKALKIFEADKRASDLYSAITNQSSLRFYNKLISV